MKVRYKISLWIVCAGLVANLALFLTALHEMTELVYRPLDEALKRAGNEIAAALPHQPLNAFPDLADVDDRFVVRVYDDNDALILARPADSVVLPLQKNRKRYTAEVADSQGRGPQAFRIRVIEVPLNGRTYTVQVATPSGARSELFELKLILILGLGSSLLLLVLISYFAAGRILQPIVTINRLAEEISDNTLDRRIPLPQSDDELRQLSVSLNRMFDRLQESFRRQKQFVASASHELKTPLTMLRLFLDNAIRRPEHEEAFRQQLLEQEAVLSRMERLIRALLDLSALGLNESLVPERFDLRKLIEATASEFDVLIEARGLRLDLDLPEALPLTGDREKLHRVLINLLDNAVKYNRAQGEISVTAAAAQGILTLTVFNTGPGIPADDLERVFEQFYRVEKSRSQQYGGSGLGLSIVRQIIALHGGGIHMESREGEWTRVIIRLPCGTPDKSMG